MSTEDVLKLLAMLERWIEGISYVEIARHYGCTRATCATRLLRIRDYLLHPQRLQRDIVPLGASQGMPKREHTRFWLNQIGKERARLKATP